MKFEISSGRENLPFEADNYYEGSGTKKQFVTHLTKLAEESNTNLEFYSDRDYAVGYLNNRKDCYYVNLTKRTKGRDIAKLDKVTLFGQKMLIFILILATLISNTLTTKASYDGTVEEDETSYIGLSKARFNTPSGAVVIPGYLARVASNYYSDLAFTFEDPKRLNEDVDQSSNYNFNTAANKSLVEAMLAYRIKYSLEQIIEESGLTLNQRQVDEATQLALWLHAATIQVDYQIDVNSIPDPTVRTLAANINTWATKQVASAGDASMSDYLFPTYEPKLNSTNAKTSREGDAVYYGPYTIQAQQGVKFSYEVMGGVVVNSSKKKVDSIITDQQFYLQYPVSYNGSKEVKFSGIQLEYELNGSYERIWLHREPEEAELKFSVGGTTGSNGLIEISTVDAITGKPVPGVTVEISTSTPQATVVTDAGGKVEYAGAPGKYKLAFNVPTGYLTPADVEVEVAFAGDIRQVKVPLEWTQSVVNFYAVDAKSLAPAGDSEAFIYDANGKAVKRIAITKGQVKGVILPEGDYLAVQYKTSNNYGLNAGVPFRAVAGKSVDVNIPQDPNVTPTKIYIEGANTTDSWVYTISSNKNILFRMNATNSLELPLPNGSYNVQATKSDGTATAGPKAFSTSLNGRTEVELSTIRGTETITFNVVDTIEKSPIPEVVLGLFDEDHTLLDYKTANGQGQVTFENVISHRIYYVNVLAAPSDVSGYSAVGNRFLGRTKTYELQLYSLKEIQEVTKVDTIYRVPNVVYTGPTYSYPQ